jgi:serine phosphatase RsbU (regulator of sigma subunit)
MMPSVTSEMNEPFGLLRRPADRKVELSVEVYDGDRIHLRRSVAGHAIIGRAADAQIRLDRGTVSRQHAELLCDPFGRWWIKDLNSRNGLLYFGRKVTERAIRSGDVFQLGEFTVRFELPEELPEDDSAGPQETNTTIVRVADGELASGVKVASDMDIPKVSAAHLTMLLEAGRDMMATELPESRLVALCQLMLRDAFKGSVATALRVTPDRLDAPQPLCPMQTLTGHGGRMPVSRSLLKAVIERNAPAMAGHATVLGGSADMVEMSMVASLRPMCAVACPLRPLTPGGSADVLYVIFPPECGCAEWLHIVALATEQYRLVEQAWAERAKAILHAAVERDLEQAWQIQERLVPQDVRAGGIEVAVGFQPCRWVAGDYVDTVALPDGRLFLTVADVCGKGLGAAMVASSLQTLVRSMLDDGVPLDRLVTRLNRHMIAYADEGRFATMCCALLDPATGVIEHANAGHPPAVIVDPVGRVRELNYGDNMPLGVEFEAFKIYRDQLELGCMLAMYSDGLTEARMAGGDLLGHERLYEHLGAVHAASAGVPLSESRAQVWQYMDTVCGGRMQDDDRTYLLARRG